MGLEIQSKTDAKVVRSIRLSVETAKILDDLVAAYDSTNGYCIEALIKAYGPAAIEGATATKPKKTRRSRINKSGTG